MTEKQFTTKGIICSSYCVWDSDDKPYGNDEVVELLNELNNENHQLKRQIGNLEHTKDFCADVCADCERLEEENKQLQLQYSELEITLMNNQLAYNDLKEENEQLKTLIKKTLETTPIEHTLAVELKNSVREFI